MKNKIKYLIILILILISMSVVVTYSYFTAGVLSNDINDVNVSTGSLNVKINDNSVNSNEISPIYDNDYEMLAYHKDFEIISDSTLNSCNKLYLHINNISDALKSNYFKYKLLGENIDLDGNFINANNSEDLLLIDNLYLEKNTTKFLDLYMWISYQDDIDQMDMLGTKIDSYLVIKSVDAKDESQCK